MRNSSALTPPGGADSIDVFCKDHDISRGFFYKLLKEGKAPRIIKVGRRTLISKEAAADWRRDMEELPAGPQEA